MGTIRQFEAFRAVIQYGTVTAAAESLNLSQPSVSKSISLLEYSIGVKLFERRRKRLYPTAEAMALYDEVDKMFVSLTRVLGMSSNLRELTTGQVNIVTSAVMGFTVLPECIGTFLDGHENANISIHVIDPNAVMQWIITQQADIGITWHGIDHPTINNQLLCNLEAVLAMPSGHVLEDCETVRPEDLKGHKFLSFSRGTRTRHRIDTTLENHGISIDNRIEAYASETLCSLVASGCGISLVNPLTAEPLVREGKISIRPFAPVILMPLHLLQPKNRPHSLLCDSFVKHMRDHLQYIFKERNIRGILQE